MASRQNRGLIQTVLGPVPKSELGPTMTHEHIYSDISFMLRPAQDTPSEDLADAPITLGNLGWIRRNYYSNRSNLQLMDLGVITKEVRAYGEAHGGAMVDATTAGIGRRPDALARISSEAGVHIIMGAGFYVDAVHPADMSERSAEDLAEEIVSDITEGVGGTGVRAGIIGEVGCSWPLTENERSSLAAAAIAQRETGASGTDSPGAPSERPRRDTRTAGKGRSGHIPGDHGTPGPHRIRAGRPPGHCRVRLLPGVGPVRQRGILLSARRDRHAQRRPAAGPD